jgi:hypothetical protein
MKARRVPRFGAVANCLFDERAVIVFLHLLAIVLGIMSALASSGGGLTMKFFEPSVPAALTSSSSSCPSEVVGSAPFLFLSLSDYFGGKDGVCFVKVRRLIPLRTHSLCGCLVRCFDPSGLDVVDPSGSS